MESLQSTQLPSLSPLVRRSRRLFLSFQSARAAIVLKETTDSKISLSSWEEITSLGWELKVKERWGCFFLLEPFPLKTSQPAQKHINTLNTGNGSVSRFNKFTLGYVRRLLMTYFEWRIYNLFLFRHRTKKETRQWEIHLTQIVALYLKSFLFVHLSFLTVWDWFGPTQSHTNTTHTYTNARTYAQCLA